MHFLARRLSSVALLAVLTLLASPVAAQAPKTPWDSLARDLLRELVTINTSQSAGSTVIAAEAMAKRARVAGFPASDVVVVPTRPNKGNLIVRLRGRQTGKKPILLLSHIDVVEAKAEDWTLPPFDFVEKEGIFYGRGVADDKDESAIHLALLFRLKAEKFVPDRDIIVALTADEEGGPDNGVEWLLANRRELIDAEFAFNEGGGGRIKDDRRLSHDVQASEKKVQNWTLEATNPGGHSSVPVKDNAITHLSDALVKLGAFDFPVRLNEVTRAYFTQLSTVTIGDIGEAMRAIVANPSDAAAARILSADPRYNSQLRTTCVATMLEGGHARNALPQRARANVNCRILPDESPDSVKEVLTRLIANPKVTITPAGEARNSPPSPLTPALMSEIARVTKAMWGDLPVIPTMSTGATDGLYLRNAGIPTYGVSGLFYLDTGAHGMNERIPARAFYEGLEFMTRLVKSLTSGGVS
ncbi:MAG TPA: M20/M25/M40 family metallo-hydrolase [Gemmatimonadales bacterium]|nr:M20/M25/M40 family metallo-hydrolase [Gemmatimonadales bacterium]